jgi:hypothetical protein
MGAMESAQNYQRRRIKTPSMLPLNAFSIGLAIWMPGLNSQEISLLLILACLIGLDCTHYHGASRVVMHQIRSVRRRETRAMRNVPTAMAKRV